MPLKTVDATVSTFDSVFEKFRSEAPRNKANLILFLADKDPSTNLSWCPDCERAEPVIYKKLEKSTDDVALLRAYVGDRPMWRNPQHPWRSDSRFKLTGVPTLIRWENGAVEGSLEDHEAHLGRKNRLPRFELSCIFCWCSLFRYEGCGLALRLAREMPRKGKETLTQTVGSNVDKTKWEGDTLDVLVEICVETLKSIKRLPDSPVPKFEWEVLATKFKARTGFNFHKHALKNKWDQLRKGWNLWRNLVANETSLGWDLVNHKVVMDDEWWDMKIKENKEYSKFRKFGFRFRDQLDFCFNGGNSTGNFYVVPSSEVNHTQTSEKNEESTPYWFEDDDNVYIPEDLHTTSLEEVREEISSANSPCRKMYSTPPQSGSSRKRKAVNKQSKLKMKKLFVTDVDDRESLTRLANAFEAQVAFNTQPKAPPSNSKSGDALTILNDMARDLHLSDELYFFGMKLFRDDYDRDCFVACLAGKRLAFLEHKYSQGKPKPLGVDG